MEGKGNFEIGNSGVATIVERIIRITRISQNLLISKHPTTIAS
jgi:hypothetical protein